MRLRLKFKAEEIWFSKNGAAAYRRGERPKFMFPEGAEIEPTITHHIQRKMKPGHRRRGGYEYTFEFVMFYKHNSQDRPST
jgi:hypothetical protein